MVTPTTYPCKSSTFVTSHRRSASGDDRAYRIDGEDEAWRDGR